MANKQTAVNKLYIYLLGIVSFDSEQLRNLYEESFEQAKQIEKEQIKRAYIVCDESATIEESRKWAEKYYNRTYGK